MFRSDYGKTPADASVELMFLFRARFMKPFTIRRGMRGKVDVGFMEHGTQVFQIDFIFAVRLQNSPICVLREFFEEELLQQVENYKAVFRQATDPTILNGGDQLLHNRLLIRTIRVDDPFQNAGDRTRSVHSAGFFPRRRLERPFRRRVETQIVEDCVTRPTGL
jgi:hypothetical protein